MRKKNNIYVLYKGHRFWVGLLADVHCTVQSILVENY
jgi:hypothetical protein